jgi:nucleoid-associated protein EbfC
MKGNIAQLMQQAQKMQENMQRAQEELARLEVTGQSGGGMVNVTISGRMECRKVRIDPSVMADPEMAEDLIAAAFNDAVNKVNAESQARMSAATAGMPIPPGMKMPF